MTSAHSQTPHVSLTCAEYVARWNLTKTHLLKTAGKTLQEWLDDQKSSETPSDEWLQLFYWMSQFHIEQPSSPRHMCPSAAEHRILLDGLIPVERNTEMQTLVSRFPYRPENTSMNFLAAAIGNPLVNIYLIAPDHLVVYNREFDLFDFIFVAKDKIIHHTNPTWEMLDALYFLLWKHNPDQRSYVRNVLCHHILQRILDINTERHSNDYNNAVAFQIATFPIYADHVVLLMQTLPSGMRVTQERYFMGLSAALYSAEAFRKTRPMKYELSNEHQRYTDCEEDKAEAPLSTAQLARTAWMHLHDQAKVIAWQFCSGEQRQCYVIHVMCPNNPNRPKEGVTFLFMRSDFVNLEQLNEKGVVIDDPI